MREKINKLGFMVMKPFIGVIISGTTRARALIIYKDEVLLVRDWLGSQRWNMPGGGVHRGEKPKNGLVRELQEELSLEVQPKQLKQIMKAEQNEHGVRFLAVVCRLSLKSKQSFTIQKSELIEAGWHKLSKLPDNLHPIVLEALKASKK